MRWRDVRVLAIDPMSRGFGFAVLESPKRLVDWAVVETRAGKHARGLRRIAELIERYRPGVLVCEDHAGKWSRRCRRVQRLLEGVRMLAAKKGIPVRARSGAQARRAVGGGSPRTKHDRATDIVERFPQLGPWSPRFRKPWMSEDPRMSIFDAIAFALTYLHDQS